MNNGIQSSSEELKQQKRAQMTCPFQYERQEKKKGKKKMVVRLRIILFIIYLQKVS
jgi:preprotein translocase subunit Sec63